MKAVLLSMRPVEITRPPQGCRVVRLGDLKEKKRPHHVEKQLTNNSC